MNFMYYFQQQSKLFQFMRARSYDNRKIQQYQSRKTNSHFVSLEVVLDKYQHENQMLSQKITSLMEQNKRLKQKKTNSDYHPLSILSIRKGEDKNIINQSYNGKNLQLLHQINKKIERTYNYSKYERYNPSIPPPLNDNHEKSIQLFQPSEYRRYSQKKQNQDQAKTQRKYTYLQNTQLDSFPVPNYSPSNYLYPKNTGQIKQSRSVQRKSLDRYRKPLKNYEQNSMEEDISNRNIQTERNYIRQNIKTQSSPLSSSIKRNSYHQVKNKFNRNVYLEKETFIQEGEQEKNPTFIQASFGYKEPKQLVESCFSEMKTPIFISSQPSIVPLGVSNKSKQNYQSRIDRSNRKLKHETIVKSFKLGKRQQQNKQNFEVKIQRIEKYQPISKQKQKFEVFLSRKNNSPYINTDYKLSQPKNQLTKIYLPEKAKEKEKQIKVDVKPIVLLEENRSIFQINESTQNSEFKKQIILKSPKQFSLTTETNQRATENTENRQRKNSIWGKKKFLNVMSRQPKKSIFLK